MNNFGEFIAQGRKNVGFRQTELARRLLKEDGTPISVQYLNDIEHDRHAAPPDNLLEELARELKINRDYIFYTAGRIPPEVRGVAPEKAVKRAFSILRKEG